MLSYDSENGNNHLFNQLETMNIFFIHTIYQTWSKKVILFYSHYKCWSCKLISWNHFIMIYWNVNQTIWIIWKQQQLAMHCSHIFFCN